MLWTLTIAPLLIPLALHLRRAPAPLLYAAAALAWLVIALAVHFGGAQDALLVEQQMVVMTFRPRHILAISLPLMLASMGFHLVLEIRHTPTRALAAKLMFWPLNLAIAAPFLWAQLVMLRAGDASFAWLGQGLSASIKVAIWVSLLTAAVVVALVLTGLWARMRAQHAALDEQ